MVIREHLLFGLMFNILRETKHARYLGIEPAAMPVWRARAFLPVMSWPRPMVSTLPLNSNFFSSWLANSKSVTHKASILEFVNIGLSSILRCRVIQPLSIKKVVRPTGQGRSAPLKLWPVDLLICSTCKVSIRFLKILSTETRWISRRCNFCGRQDNWINKGSERWGLFNAYRTLLEAAVGLFSLGERAGRVKNRWPFQTLTWEGSSLS